MIIEAKEHIGKKMDWTEIEKLFPDCYVALDDYHTDGHKANGILCYVCTTQDEMTEELKKWASKGKKLFKIYTTESEEYNGLWQL